MSTMYTLDGKTPVRCDSIEQWGKWFAENNRRVAETKIGPIIISTVFLGIDHNFGVGDSPLLFETMVFGGPTDGEMGRYPTWDKAEDGHVLMVAFVKRTLQGDK